MIFNNLFKRLFNRVTITKVIFIFGVGLFSRVFINYFYEVNVFVEYTNLISLYYYGFMSLIIVFISEIVSYFELDIFALFGNFIRFIISFIYSLCNLFRYLLFGERYFTLGNGSPTIKPFDFKQDKFVLQRNGNGRWLSQGKPGPAAVQGLYGHDIRRPHSAAVVGLYGDHSGSGRSGNGGQSEFNRERNSGGRSRSGTHVYDRYPVDVSTTQDYYGYRHSRSGSYGTSRHELHGYPRAHNSGLYELDNNDVGVRHELGNNQVGDAYTVGYFQLSGGRRHELGGSSRDSYGSYYQYDRYGSNQSNNTSGSSGSSDLLGEVREGEVESESSVLRTTIWYVDHLRQENDRLRREYDELLNRRNRRFTDFLRSRR